MGKKFRSILTDITLIAVSFFIPGSRFLLSTLRVAVALKGLNRLVSDITGKPRSNPTPINITVRGTVEARRIIFGTRRAGGVLVFYGVSGSNNMYLWYVIAYAGHQSSAFSDFWLDERRIASSDIPSGSGGTVTASPWNSKLQIFKHLGTSSQAVDSSMTAAFGAWDSSHKLLGTTYAVIRMERDEGVYPDGAPQSITALIDGLLLYDPRKDSTNGGSGSHRMSDPSTWEFSRNSVLATRWYMTGGSVHNDVTSRLVMYGLRELDSRIDDAYTIANANHCDETLSGANAPPSGSQLRYRCDLEANCGETRRDILTALLATMAGTMVYVKGKWRIHAGIYDTPVHTLSETALYGELEVQDTTTHADRYNAVCPVFIDSSNQYIQTTGIYRTDSSYETQDGGERIPVTLQLDGVTDQYQAQRLAEIHLRRSRMMRGIKIVGALNLLKVALHETISYSHSRYGWTNRVYRCKERGFEPDQDACRMTLQLQRDDSGVYTDLLTADYTTGTSNTDVFHKDGPDTPTGLTITSYPQMVRFDVALPTYLNPDYVLELWEYTASTPFSSATKIAEAKTSFIDVAKRDTTSRYYWVRVRTADGQVSGTYPASTGQSGAADLVLTNDLGNNAATSPQSTSLAGPTTLSAGDTVIATYTFSDPGTAVSGAFVSVHYSMDGYGSFAGCFSSYVTYADSSGQTQKANSYAGGASPTTNTSFGATATFPVTGGNGTITVKLWMHVGSLRTMTYQNLEFFAELIKR